MYTLLQHAKTPILCVNVMVRLIIAGNIQTTWQYDVLKHATCVLTKSSGKSYSVHELLFRNCRGVL